MRGKLIIFRKIKAKRKFCLYVMGVFLGLVSHSLSCGDTDPDPTGNPPAPLAVTQILFGESAGNEGQISFPTSSFSTGENEVYYLIDFDQALNRRTKFRKTWQKNNNGNWNDLFTAIQIAEAGERRLFGVWRKKNNGLALGFGTYRLKVERHNSGNYEHLYTSEQFTIE